MNGSAVSVVATAFAVGDAAFDADAEALARTDVKGREEGDADVGRGVGSTDERAGEAGSALRDLNSRLPAANQREHRQCDDPHGELQPAS